MTAPNVRTLPTAPSPTDAPSVFNSRAFAFVAAMTGWTEDINDLVEWINVNFGRYNVKVVVTNSYNVIAEDVGKYIVLTSTDAKTINVAALDISDVGASWSFRNAAASNVTFNEAEGVTINPPAGGTLVFAPSGTVSLVYRGSSVFDLFGQVVPA